MVEFSCVVLAGGKSRRMGRDKRGLLIGGKSFLEIALDHAREASSDVVVSLGDECQVPEGLDGVKVVIDEVKGRGPLYGVLSSLKRCSMDYAALLPVDAPLLFPDIYGVMVREIEVDPGLDAVVPRGKAGMDPLLGVYRVDRFISACTQEVAEGFDRVVGAVERLKRVRYLDREVFRGVDPKLLSFHNINTWADLDRLMEKIDEDK